MANSTESFLESSTKILVFLFLLSITYYLSFWIHFDINIFQYIALEDITKGIAYPLRFAGVGIVAIAVFIILLIFAAVFIEGRNKNGETKRIIKSSKAARTTLAILSATALLASLAFYFVPEVTIVGIAVGFVLTLFLIVLYYIVEDSDSEDDSLLDEIIAPYLAYCAIFLIINSIVAGVYEANKIQKEIEYNYVLQEDIADKIKTKAPYLIFLGAVSDKYIFIDRAGFERYVVDKSELPSLKFHHYDRGNKASVQHMENVLELGQLQPKRPMLIDTTAKQLPDSISK